MKQIQMTLFGISVFCLINIPSIKLITGPGQTINIIVLFFLSAASFYRIYKKEIIEVDQTKILLSILITVSFFFVVIPEFAGIRSIGNQYIYEFLGLLYGTTVVIIILYTGKEKDIKTYVLAQLIWGVLISTLYITGVLSYYNYNHVTTPIVLSTLILLAGVYYNGIRDVWGVSSVLIILFQLGILSTLGGRSPFIGIPLSILILILIQSVYSGRDMFQSIVTVFGTLLGGIIVILFGIHFSIINVSNLISERIFRIVTAPRSEPRFERYMIIIEMIAQNPVGYGLGTFTEITDIGHPDNLYLHIFFNGGWVVAFFVTIFLILGISVGARRSVSKNTVYSSSILLITIYLTTVLSLSTMITDMYLIFSAIALCVIPHLKN